MRTPVPPGMSEARKIRRTRIGLRLKYEAMPEATPAITALSVSR